ncbi:MAG: protoheme IX farnesyltransferase, partial [Actinobacteria bacterium]|nr:protoheme IX farnesyltransferase [Actinomycetota bacterium]
MKLRVVELLLVSTLPAMVLAEQGLPKLSVTLATLIGGTLAAGAANAFNQVMEQDLDVAMGRTSKRPLVVGAISTRLALSFAGLLALISLAIFWVFTNPLATVLTLIAIAFYVGIYTAVLKRRTPQNIVWGGIAGCMPVLIGWAAVTNSLSLSAFLLFLVIFFWTPPHFWALAIKYKEDYSRANVPMLPVVAAERIVTRQMLAHAVAMIASSIALGVVAALPTWYFVIAVLLGIYFLY